MSSRMPSFSMKRHSSSETGFHGFRARIRRCLLELIQPKSHPANRCGVLAHFCAVWPSCRFWEGTGRLCKLRLGSACWSNIRKPKACKSGSARPLMESILATFVLESPRTRRLKRSKARSLTRPRFTWLPTLRVGHCSHPAPLGA